MIPARLLLFFSGAIAIAAFVNATDASAIVYPATARQVTNIADEFTRHPSVDKKGKKVVFLSKAPHEGSAPPFDFDATFDFDGAGNDFGTGGSPRPACPTCDDVADKDNPVNVYLWTRSSNEVMQLTFSKSGGDTGNRWPEIDPSGSWVTWDSKRDHVPGAPGNSDGNGEIFMLSLSDLSIVQVTDTLGGGADANRRASVDNRGRTVAFESTRDFSGTESTCRMPDGTTPCSNADGNTEIMTFEPESGRLTQITSTTGDTAGEANGRARVGIDGRFLVFQSTRDLGVEQAAGTSCVGLDGESCSNPDGSAEIFRYDRGSGELVQVTKIGSRERECVGGEPNQWPDVSKKGKYVVFQSKCEKKLNPEGCGSCTANNEIFLASMRSREIHQVTLSDAGRSRFPRISGTGAYVAFQSDRSFSGENPEHGDVLYLLRRASTRSGPTSTSATQLLEDATLTGGGLLQNPTVRITVPDVVGGFDSDFERIGLSASGKYLTVHNDGGTSRQEIWFVDRKK